MARWSKERELGRRGWLGCVFGTDLGYFKTEEAVTDNFNDGFKNRGKGVAALFEAIRISESTERTVDVTCFYVFTVLTLFFIKLAVHTLKDCFFAMCCLFHLFWYCFCGGCFPDLFTFSPMSYILFKDYGTVTIAKLYRSA